MDIYTKIRTLALLDTTMRSYFGTGPFRWVRQRLEPGYIKSGTCLRMKVVSSIFGYTNAPAGLMALNQPYMQFDILDMDSTRLVAAKDAVIAWMGTVSFAASNDFDSPASTPPNSPNFLLNRRSGMEAQPEPPGPAYVETLDFRIYNMES